MPSYLLWGQLHIAVNPEFLRGASPEDDGVEHDSALSVQEEAVHRFLERLSRLKKFVVNLQVVLLLL